MAVQIVTNVPPDKVDTYTQIFLNAGATSVSPAPEDDGEVTLIVVYPDHEAMLASLAGGEARPEPTDPANSEPGRRGPVTL